MISKITQTTPLFNEPDEAPDEPGLRRQPDAIDAQQLRTEPGTDANGRNFAGDDSNQDQLREAKAFCHMFASQGFIYKSDEAAGRFGHFHRNSGCRVVVSTNVDGLGSHDPDREYHRRGRSIVPSTPTVRPFQRPEGTRSSEKLSIATEGEHREPALPQRGRMKKAISRSLAMRARRTRTHTPAMVSPTKNHHMHIAAFRVRLRGRSVSAKPMIEEGISHGPRTTPHRRGLILQTARFLCISIHVPAGGAT